MTKPRPRAARSQLCVGVPDSLIGMVPASPGQRPCCAGWDPKKGARSWRRAVAAAAAVTLLLCQPLAVADKITYKEAARNGDSSVQVRASHRRGRAP